MAPMRTSAAAVALLASSLLCSVAAAADAAEVEGCPCFDACSPSDDPSYRAHGRDSCFRLSFARRTWAEALAACKRDGGTLVELSSESTLQYVTANYLPTVSVDTWVGARRSAGTDPAPLWRWAAGGEPVSTSLVHPSVAAGSGGSGALCGFLPNSGAAAASLFGFSCASLMGSLCQKRRTLFDASVTRLSAASALSMTEVAVVLTGSGVPEGLFLALSTAGCAESGAAAEALAAKVTVTGVTASGATLAVDSADLGVGLTYDVCWGLRDAAGAAGGRQARTGVRVAVAGLASLAAQDVLVQAAALGKTIEVTGSGLTADVWGALFVAADCRGAASAPPTLVAPAAGADGDRGAFATPAGLPADGVRRTLCVAASRNTPGLAAFSPTAVTVTPVPAPVLETRDVYLAYAESFAPHALVLAGRHLVQPGPWSVALFDTPLCQGAPRVADQAMVGCSESSCGYTLPSGAQSAGVVLHACARAGGPGYAPTGLTILGTPAPVFSDKSAQTIPVTYAEAASGEKVVELFGRNLETPGRPASGASSMLHVVLVRSGVGGDGSTCNGAVVAFANLTAVNPAGARFRIPPGLGGDVAVCVAAASATPAAAGDWSAVFPTGLALEVALPPVFDAAATPPVLLGWNARLGGDAGSATVPVAGVRFGTRHLWIRATTAAAGGCSGGGGGEAAAMPAVSATELRVPVASLLAAVPADAAAPTTVLLCWAAAAAAAAPPADAAVWADSGVAIKALPRPLVNASSPPVPVVLTAHEAAAAAVRPRLQVSGAYLQASVMWACYARAPGGLGGGDAGGLVGVACLPAAAACGGQPGDAWCAQASFEVPPLAVGAYHVLLSLGRTAPAAVSAAAVPLGYTVEVAAPPSFEAASQAVSVGKLQDGFPLALKGTSVGEGAWVWFQAAAAQEAPCAHPASDAVKLPLVGDKRAAATTLAVPARHPPLTGGGGRYKMCVSATRAAADSAAGETGVSLEVSGPPVFHHTTLTPSLGELWGSGGYRASLQGTNLEQADLWAAVCRADCSACTSPPFRLAAGGTLAVPPSASPTAAAGEPATMCFGTYFTSPSQLSPSSVRVAIPSVPALSAAPQLYPTGATSFNLTPAEGAASDSSALFVAGEVYASFCSGPWLPVAVAANHPPRFTPPTPPPPGVAQRVCLAFVRVDETPGDASPSFSTPLAVTRVGPPAATGGGVPPQRVPLAAIAAGEAEVAVEGTNLWPGVWAAHVAADASCAGAPGGHLLDGARNGTSALYKVGPLEGGYPENMKLCWTGVDEAGQPLREAAAELGVRFTLQPMPTFDAAVPPLPVVAASTLLGGAPVAVEVRGTQFTNELYLTLQRLSDAAAPVDCGAATRIGAPLPLFKRSATAGFAAASGAALLASGARVVGVCWLAAPADSSSAVAADAAAFPTGARTALARLPAVAARAHTATLKSLAAGGVRLPVTGTDLSEDTAVWFGCGGAAALPPPTRLSKAGGGGGWELAVPATLAGPTRTEVALCVGVARTNDSVVVGAAAAAVGWRLLLSGVPEVLAWDGLAEPAASVRVRGSHLVPSASTTGVLLLFRPVADACPSSPAGVAGAVEAPSNDFLLKLPAAAAAGDDLRLCVGLRTGGPFAATAFRVVLRVPPPVTPVPATPAPKTDAPPTDVPDTDVPKTAVPDTPAPCPSPAEMGATLRDECFYGSTGLVKCFRQTNQAGCEAGYLRCVKQAEGVHAPCFASPGSGSELQVLLPMDVGDFLHVLFRATVAASALVPPEYVSVRSVFPGSTVVTFSLAGDTGAVARLNHSLTGGTPIFAELGTGWTGARLVEANNSTPVPATPAPPAVVDNGGDSGGVGVGIIVLIAVAALVAVLGCCTAVYCYRKSQLAEEEAAEAAAAAAAAKEEEEGRSRSASFGEGAGEGVRGPCGGLLSECLCGTGQCGCVFCTRAAAAGTGTGTVRTEGVASLGSTEWGCDELVESPEQTRPRTRLPSIPREETPGGATSRSDGSFVPETLERALPPPEAVRREWMLTPAGQRQRPAAGRGGGVGGGTVDVPPGSSVSGVSTAAATSPSTGGGGGSRRRWMMDAPARNPLPPPGAAAARQTPAGVDAVCHVCRNLWEGGRFCGHCGAPHDDIVEVIKYDKPFVP